AARLAPTGAPDAYFGSSGTTAFSFPGSILDEADAVAVDAADNVYLAGLAAAGGAKQGVAKLTAAAGAHDPNFGSGGYVTISFPNAGARAEGVAVQPDGKVVVGGYMDNGVNGTQDFTAVRLTPAGQIDTDFNPNGPSPGRIQFD